MMLRDESGILNRDREEVLPIKVPFALHVRVEVRKHALQRQAVVHGGKGLHHIGERFGSVSEEELFYQFLTGQGPDLDLYIRIGLLKGGLGLFQPRLPTVRGLMSVHNGRLRLRLWRKQDGKEHDYGN